MHATKAVIYLDNLKNNYRNIREYVGKEVKICAAVKADAYGHGEKEVSRVLDAEGVDYFAVATVLEGMTIRKADITKPIILLTPSLPSEYENILRYDITPIITDETQISGLIETAKSGGKPISVHLKIDTGMGRIGCSPENALSFAEKIHNSPFLQLAGICTHFPCSDAEERSTTLSQIEAFKRIIQIIRDKGIPTGIVHTANSGAIIDYPESYFDMVRPGILLYGYYPSHDQKRPINVKPVMQLETQIVFLKKTPKGTPISYGMTYVTKEDTWIATLPVGYGDGYNRRLSNKGKVLINNKLYPIVGRVCMDQLLVNLGPETDIKLYDKAILFGPHKELSAETLADQLDTIPYEVTCWVSKRAHRFPVF